VSDLLVIIALTVGSCLGVGVLGAMVLHAGRRRSVGFQLTVAALLPVIAVVATVLINVRLMFLSRHDTTVILVALVIALVLAVAGAGLVVRRIVSASREVGAGLSQLVTDSTGSRGDSEPSATPGDRALPREFADVLAELADARRTLAQSRARERATEQSRRELVSFMSHDLRTPLAGLRALAEGLEDGVIDDVPRALSHLRSTVSRMTILVDDLFALSRVQGAPVAKQESLVSLTEIITDVAAEATASASAQGVSLDVKLPGHDRLAVLGSPDDLTRALANLVANAIRHTDPGLTVRLLGARADDGRVRVAVVDACGGIPEASLPKLFDTGWRGTPSRSGDDGGSGLGLAIARGVVQSHAGQIGVHNVEGGCRFEMELPASVPESETSR
jgi:signal transduction histidine kinase